MIDSLTISDVATFGSSPEHLGPLSQLNFVFGANGAGKTTLSRVIADSTRYPSCTVSWRTAIPLEPLVYNRDFVERSFTQSPELRGVFTLGEQQVDTLARIASAKSDVDALAVKIDTLTNTLQGADGLGGKKGQLAELELALKHKCWSQKQKYDAAFQGAFEGLRNSAEKFKARVLLEHANNNAGLLSLAELEQKAASVFGPAPKQVALLPAIDGSLLLSFESNYVLGKAVVGKNDVDIAALILKLGNSDWVNEGRRFFDASRDLCPFCQQTAPSSLERSLGEFFDETFAADSKAIEDLSSRYALEAARIERQISAMVTQAPQFIDLDGLKAATAIFSARVEVNNQRLAGKKQEPSRSVTLETLSDTFDALKALIDHANSMATAHNTVVANLGAERTLLTAQVWRFVLNEMSADIKAYSAARTGAEKAIAMLSSQIAEARRQRSEKTAEIRQLEKQTTSIQPTVDGINSLLSSFGFQGFKLAQAASGTSYRLVRPDGSDAKDTLSEGEKTFVTFLYFYHLLKGSESDTGMTSDRIVVFDDPVSSLDSDILFIVSSLIKGLFDEVRSNTGHIKQVFVLSHNVYFHKEVSYNPKRTDVAMREETFWVVRKPSAVSKIEGSPTNPIKTSYELLWSEVRRPTRSNLSIQNTLRRILENYFKILGGISIDDLCARFDGKEKLICKSLCSWMHDGSHNAHDDLYVTIDDSMVDAYLGVFRAIFEKNGHSAHYRMMMADAFVATSAAPAGP